MHFVHKQGLQSLLLVIKRVGEEAAALWEPETQLPPPQARGDAGPGPLGPAHSPGTSFLGEGQGIAQLRDRNLLEGDKEQTRA